jgi:hypothetical protein
VTVPSKVSKNLKNCVGHLRKEEHQMSRWTVEWETQDYGKDGIGGITWRPPFEIKADSLGEAMTIAKKRTHIELRKLRKKHPEDFRYSSYNVPRILSLKEEGGAYHKLSNPHTIFGDKIIEKDDYGSSESSYAYPDQD